MNNLIDWDSVINHISTQSGVVVNTDLEKCRADVPGYNEIHLMWKQAKFNPAAIKWINYYPGTHFDNEITETIAAYLDLNIHRSWISRIDPGYFAPLHWDVDDNETEYLKKGPIVRYSCFIEKPTFGHIFSIGDICFYNQPQGTLYKWDNYREWHSGINAGMTPKYMFHLLGY
jgi:hypothetical protein